MYDISTAMWLNGAGKNQIEWLEIIGELYIGYSKLIS